MRVVRHSDEYRVHCGRADTGMGGCAGGCSTQLTQISVVRVPRNTSERMASSQFCPASVLNAQPSIARTREASFHGRIETIPAQMQTATIAVVPEAINQSVVWKFGGGAGPHDPPPSSSHTSASCAMSSPICSPDPTGWPSPRPSSTRTHLAAQDEDRPLLSAVSPVVDGRRAPPGAGGAVDLRTADDCSGARTPWTPKSKVK